METAASEITEHSVSVPHVDGSGAQGNPDTLRMSRRKFLKLGIGVTALLTLPDFLTACGDSSEKPLLPEERMILESVKTYNDAYSLLGDERKGVAFPILTSLSATIANDASGSTIQQTIEVYKHSFQPLTKGHDTNVDDMAHFLSFTSIASKTPKEEIARLSDEAHALDSKISPSDGYYLAGYAALYGKPVGEIKRLVDISRQKVGNDSLLPALIEGTDSEGTIRLYDALQKRDRKNPLSELTLMAIRANGDIDKVLSIFRNNEHEFLSGEWAARLALAAQKVGDTEKVTRMWEKGRSHLDGFSEREISAALVLATVDKSPSSLLLSERTPIKLSDSTGLTSNPGGPSYSSNNGYANK